MKKDIESDNMMENMMKVNNRNVLPKKEMWVRN